jgi:hypothetical protein
MNSVILGTGVLIGMVIICLIDLVTYQPGGTLGVAQSKYRECLSLQAPEDVCLKTYLLPKK